MWNARLDDSQKLESRLLGEISVTQGGGWHHPNDRKQKGTKELLDKGARGEWRSWLKTEHSKTKIMASDHIASWQIDGGKKWKQWQTLFSWAPKSLRTVTAARKLRHPLLGRKAMTNLNSILQSREITLLTKLYIVKVMVSLVVMCRCESWTIKKAECWKNDAYKLWCWRRLLRVPWIARRSNQSILREFNPEYSLEGLMLKWSSNTLGTWCKELIHWKRPWCWERLRARGEGGERGWDGWMASLTQWSWVWANSERQWRTGKPGVLQSMGSQRIRHDWAIEQQWWLPGLWGEEVGELFNRYRVLIWYD